MFMNARTLICLALLLVLAGCTAAPERPKTVRQALLGLGERAAEQVAASPALPKPTTDQVLLLAMPKVDPELGLSDERLMESLTRACWGSTIVLRYSTGDPLWAMAQATINGAWKAV